MNTVANDVMVDAGMILVFDPQILIDKGYIKQENIDGHVDYRFFEMENGRYRVFSNIEESWNGEVHDEGEILVISGKIAVGDPCYCFDNLWDKFLNETNYGSNVSNCFTIESMGGDGTYDVNLTFERIGD